MATLQHQLPGVVLGELVGVTSDGRPLVRLEPGSTPYAATFAGFGAAPDWRQLTGARLAMAFVDGDRRQPLVLGVVGGTAAAPATATAPTPMPRNLKIAAGEEITIECGKSKIHLRADGRIEIRGEHLVSRSRGPNKVKGGSVHLN